MIFSLSFQNEKTSFLFLKRETNTGILHTVVATYILVPTSETATLLITSCPTLNMHLPTDQKGQYQEAEEANDGAWRCHWCQLDGEHCGERPTGNNKGQSVHECERECVKYPNIYSRT